MKKYVAVLLALVLALSLTSCSMADEFLEDVVEEIVDRLEGNTAQTYEVEEMRITLRGAFVRQETPAEGYDVGFLSVNVGVLVARLTYEGMGYEEDPGLSARRLAELYAAASDTSTAVTEEAGVVSFSDTATVEGVEYTYVYSFYVSEQAYWMVAAYCPTEDFDEYRSEFTAWAGSVTFAGDEASTDGSGGAVEEGAADTETGYVKHPDVTAEGITFISLGDGTCKIKGADKSMEGRVVVPAQSPYGDVVTTVATGAFKGFRNIVSVRLPDTVTVIGGSAFQGCGALQNVKFPEEVTEFGSSMFNGCGELRRVTLPRGVTEIPAMTFQTCVNLESVEMQGNKITSIGANAFNGCRSLVSLTIPGGLQSIGEAAFKNSWPSVIYYGGSLKEWRQVEIHAVDNGGLQWTDVVVQ